MSGQFKASGFFLLRTPLLASDILSQWARLSDSLEHPEHESEASDAERVRAVSSAQRAFLKESVDDPAIREALFVASPDLVQSLAQWESDPTSDKGQRTEQSLVRYFARMTNRATPFGLFAGCSFGTVGQATEMRLRERASYQRVSRLDMDYLTAITDLLALDATLRPALSFRTNSSVLASDDRLHYVSTRVVNRVRGYELVGADCSPELDKLLLRAMDGCSFNELVELLIDESIDREESELFVAEVIESQLLVPDLMPTLTGPEPIYELIATLRRSPEHVAVADRLSDIRARLDAMDRAPLGTVAIQDYEAIADATKELPVSCTTTRLLQVDLYKPTERMTLDAEVVKEVSSALDVLVRMQIPRDPLRGFREQFVERYEQRMMPLLEVIDAELGIGIPAADSPGNELHLAERRSTVLAQLLLRAKGERLEEIVLDQQTIQSLTIAAPSRQPDALGAHFTLLLADQDAIDQEDFRLVWKGAVGPSGVVLLGRFSHLDDTLSSLVRQHIAEEESLDSAIFAEVVHLPQGRIGNVIARPRLREFEIPFLGRSSVAADKQLDLQDLCVTVKGDQVILFSKRHQREVRPRLTSAANFEASNTLDVYRFLCLLQGQQTYYWNWGSLGALPHLPRVRIGRTIVSAATWTAPADVIAHWRKAAGIERHCAVQQWRQANMVPRFVNLLEGDNLLPTDLASMLSIDACVERLREGQGALFGETSFAGFASPVNAPEGRFANEIVLPMVRSAEVKPPQQSKTLAAPVSGLRRYFPPGSEWQYAKLYTGTAIQERVLRNLVQPLVARLRAEGAIDCWYFVRYRDPRPHLRLRFHASRGRRDKLSEAIHDLLHDVTSRSIVWNTQLETYHPEIERYGGPEAMMLAEHLFQVDSDAVLELLRAYPGKEKHSIRIPYSVCVHDAILSSVLGRGPTEAFLAKINKQASPGLVRARGAHYRTLRADVERLFALTKIPEADTLSDAARIVSVFSSGTADVSAALNALDTAGRLSVSREELVRSLIHMHVNRLFAQSDTGRESSLPDFLRRYYLGQAGRASASQG